GGGAAALPGSTAGGGSTAACSSNSALTAALATAAAAAAAGAAAASHTAAPTTPGGSSSLPHCPPSSSAATGATRPGGPAGEGSGSGGVPAPVPSLAVLSEGGAEFLSAEELTRSVIPTPAQPPQGVELKVPPDDIRFTGVRLRFLMGLLEAIEPHPELCRTTADLVHNFVVPLTSDRKCRLLDLIPPEQRGQPHHYICHA
ncbi:hypothetical protein Agub_g6121, partial [Astrephomene gubernaculifera]